MIVKCEQCQTKFKIPDDKVTDKGVKVRCTKCGHTFRVTKESAVPASGALPPAPPPPPAPKTVTLDSADPFSRFGQPNALPKEAQTRPGVFALGVEASRMPDLGRPPVAPPPAPPRAALPPIPAPQAGAPSPFDFGSLVPPTAAPPVTAPAPAPFDFSSLVAASPPSSPKPAAGPAPFDFSALTAPPPPAPAAVAIPAPRTSPPARPIDAPPMSFDFSAGLGPPPAPAAPPAPPPSGGAFGLLGDLPPPPTGPASSAPLGDDFFAAPMQQVAGPLPVVPEGASTEEARSALFDMSAGAGPVPSAPASEPMPVLPPPEPADFGPSSVSMRVPKPPDSATERGRRVLGIVVNVFIAVLLVVGLVVVASATLNEGKLDLQSIGSSLKALVTPTSQFSAEDISNGLYDTKMGRPVFYVRGVVMNRSSGAARVRVRAEILDGQTLVRSAEVVAGVPPSPEELFRLSMPDEVKALLERGGSKAPPVEAGGSAPFLVPFAEYPPDLKAFRVRVTATPDGQATASAP
jgi:predicted Zn finger-like uncharacterized protein